MGGKRLSVSERRAVVSAVVGGASTSDVAKDFGVSTTTIQKIMRKKRPSTIAKMANGHVEPRGACARCRKLESALLDMMIKM